MGDIEISGIGHLHICSQPDGWMMDICQGKEDGCYDFEASSANILIRVVLTKVYLLNSFF